MICICFKIFKYAVTTTFSESSKKIKLSFLTFLSCDEEHCCLCYYHQISTFFAVMSSNVLSSMDIRCEFFLNAKRLTRLMKKAHIWFVLVSLNVSASTSRFFFKHHLRVQRREPHQDLICVLGDSTRYEPLCFRINSRSTKPSSAENLY